MSLPSPPHGTLSGGVMGVECKKLTLVECKKLTLVEQHALTLVESTQA
jgi:hypothetical protein